AHSVSQCRLRNSSHVSSPRRGPGSTPFSSHRRVGENILEGSELEIRFPDGRTWRTGQTFELPRDNAERDRFLAFLERTTGKPIKLPRLLRDMLGPTFRE